MATKLKTASAEADLAFMRSIVEGGGRMPMSAAICYLAGGLLYGCQCLFHMGQAAGLITWGAVPSLAFVIGISVAFFVVLIWAIHRDNRDGAAHRKGTLSNRAVNAALSGTGMANAAVIIIFGIGAARDQDFAVWLYYPAIIFALQSAAWFVGWSLKKKRWMLATSLGGWLTAVALGVLVREPVAYLGVCTAALFLLFAGPGLIMYLEARAPRPVS